MLSLGSVLLQVIPKFLEPSFIAIIHQVQNPVADNYIRFSLKDWLEN